jgi:ABC-type transport system involved in cytochrome c biogenesis permease subunit
MFIRRGRGNQEKHVEPAGKAGGDCSHVWVPMAVTAAALQGALLGVAVAMVERTAARSRGDMKGQAR